MNNRLNRLDMSYMNTLIAGLHSVSLSSPKVKVYRPEPIYLYGGAPYRPKIIYLYG